MRTRTSGRVPVAVPIPVPGEWEGAGVAVPVVETDERAVWKMIGEGDAAADGPGESPRGAKGSDGCCARCGEIAGREDPARGRGCTGSAGPATVIPRWRSCSCGHSFPFFILQTT